MAAIDTFWDCVKDKVYIDKETFIRNLYGYTLTEFANDEGVYLIIVEKGPHFHFITTGVKWKLNKEILQKYPGSLIEEFGFAETKTPIEDTRQQRFNKRLGFIETGRDQTYVYYRIHKMNFLNEVQSCQP